MNDDLEHEAILSNAFLGLVSIIQVQLGRDFSAKKGLCVIAQRIKNMSYKINLLMVHFRWIINFVMSFRIRGRGKYRKYRCTDVLSEKKTKKKT